MVHRGEIYQHAGITCAEFGSVLAYAPHRQWQIVGLDKIKSTSGIRRASTPDDQCWVLIECAVEDWRDDS